MESPTSQKLKMNNFLPIVKIQFRKIWTISLLISKHLKDICAFKSGGQLR